MSIKLWDGKSELQHGDWVGLRNRSYAEWTVACYVGKDSAGWYTVELFSDAEEAYDAWTNCSCFTTTTVEAVQKANDILAGERQP